MTGTVARKVRIGRRYKTSLFPGHQLPNQRRGLFLDLWFDDWSFGFLKNA
jgi:hypothetical protein